MSGPFDQHPNIPPPDQFDPSYGMYDPHLEGTYTGIPPAAAAFDRVAFWYRPEPQEGIYHGETGLYNQSIPLQGTQMESQTGVKHRRTRSGCFTCRSRRVKCDETRPVCDRCRKGNRECEFPLQSSSSKRQKSGESRQSVSESASQIGKDDNKLDTIQDESEEEEEEEDEEIEAISPKPSSSRPKLERLRTHSTHNVNRKQRRRQRSDASSAIREKASSPSTEASEPLSGKHTPTSVELTPTTTNTSIMNRTQRWKKIKPDLKPEMEKHLHFQHENMTYHHYFFKLDTNDFIHNELIDLALQYEPLLFAVVGFAAYHHTLQLPESEANFNLFWKYYCKSIMSLRKWLERHKERNNAVLLTVLQLATFEEYLGDWPNLSIHHKAAYSILTSLYKPDTITQSNTSRKIFDWYVRFDVISGIMAVRDATLGREWLSTVEEWWENKAKQETSESTALLESTVATLRLIGFDIAHLFATAAAAQAQQAQQGQTNLINPNFVNDFMGEVSGISTRLDEFRQRVEKLNNIHLTATDVVMPAPGEDTTFDPAIPLFRDTLWPLNFVWIDWYAIEQLHKYQTFVFLQKINQVQQLQQPNQPSPQTDNRFPPELAKLSELQCQIYEAIERTANAPAGAVLGCHASLGLSVVFLPKPPPEENNRYVMWARRKLANIERMGYVWPPQFRQRMSQLWDLEALEDWWLPNGEGKFKLLDEIRTVVEDRNQAAAEQLQRTGKDDDGVGLRQIKVLFEGLEVGRPGSARGESSVDALGHSRFSLSSASEADSSGTSNKGFSPGGSSTAERDGSLGKGSNQPRSRPSLAGTTPLMRPPSTADTAGDRMSGVWEGPVDEAKSP